MRFKRGAKSALNNEIEAKVFNIDPLDVPRMVATLGRAGLAAQLAGTTDKSSREYKNARDSVSRWLRGARTPSAANIGRLEKSARKTKVEELRAQPALNAVTVADVQKSKRVWKNGRIVATLDGADLEEFLAALESGDSKEAMSKMLDAYGLEADDVASINAVHSFDIY